MTSTVPMTPTTGTASVLVPEPAPISEEQPEVLADKGKAKQRQYRQYDDVYITRAAGDLLFIRVFEDSKREATVGAFHQQPAQERWVLQALEEAARLARARSTVRIHTTESEIAEVLRAGGLRSKASDSEYGELKRNLAQAGKDFILARPERETPVWRKMLKLLQKGELLNPSPFVTYSAYTSAVTDYERVYRGVIIVGLGNIVIHSDAIEGENLIDAELAMLEWVTDQVGGGARIDVHHSSDGARRIWEQVALLAQEQDSDPLANAGDRLRNLVRKTARANIQVTVARRPNEEFRTFAKMAAASAFVGSDFW